MRLPSPEQRETLRHFIAESTETHIDGVAFERLPAGCQMIVHYRDALGFSHRKTISSPDARNDDDVVSMAVIFSDWLSHPFTKQNDALQVAGNA